MQLSASIGLLTGSFSKTMKESSFRANQRYDYHRLLWIKEGKGTLSVDFRPFDLLPHQLYFFSPRQLVSLEKSDIIRAEGLFFRDDLLYSHTNDDDLLTKCNLLDDPELPLIVVPEREETLTNLFELIRTEAQQPEHSRQARILRSYLKAFVLQAERIKGGTLPSPTLTDDCLIFLSFKQNVSQTINLHRTVSEYAHDLNVTPKKLNRVVKQLVGTTVHQYISGRLLLEAKRRLYFNNRSVKEVAYELGFNDASNFTRTFKKLEGLSPEGFRNQRHHQ